MKNVNAIGFCTIFLLLLSCSKTAREQQSAEPSISVDKNSIVVYSDNVREASAESGVSDWVIDTLQILSNRSWTATITTEDGGDWLSVSDTEHINFSGLMEKLQCEVICERNYGDLRKGIVSFNAQGCEPVVVSVEQKEFVPYLELKSYSDPRMVSYTADTCQVLVKCNTLWTAAIAEGATVNVELSSDKGSDAELLNLSFPFNFDDESGKKATLTVKAEGCQDAGIEFIQSQTYPFFELEYEVERVQNPMNRDIVIPLRSNREWSAEISECTFKNASLVPSEGDGTIDGIRFCSDHGCDPEVKEKHATVTIHREGYEDIVVSFSQQGSIHLDFMDYNPEYNKKYTDPTKTYQPYLPCEWPFLTPLEEEIPTSVSSRKYASQELDCVTPDGKYTFTMFGRSAGVWYSSRQSGFQVGKSLDDYILLPSADGLRLKKMFFESACGTMTTFTVKTADGSRIISGGEKKSSQTFFMIYSEHNGVIESEFPDTQKEERYKMCLETSNGILSIKEICLIYE